MAGILSDSQTHYLLGSGYCESKAHYAQGIDSTGNNNEVYWKGRGTYAGRLEGNVGTGRVILGKGYWWEGALRAEIRMGYWDGY